MLREFSDKKICCKIYSVTSRKDRNGLVVWNEKEVDARFCLFRPGESFTLLEVHRYFCSILFEHPHPKGQYRVTTTFGSLTNASLSSYVTIS